MKKSICILAGMLCSLYSNSTTAKSNEDLLRANYLYRHLAFHEAIPYYEKIADNANSADIYGQLGDCYLLTKKPEQAIVWYAKAVKINGCSDETKLHYGQALMNLQMYNDALPMLKQYQATHTEERRVANLIRSCQSATAMLDKMPEGSVNFLAFNTNGSDFGPALRKGELVFASDTVITGTAKTDNWTGSSFYNMYSVACTDRAQCKNELQKVGNKLNTKFHDGPCTFTADAREMYFTRTNYIQQFLNSGTPTDKQGVVRLQIMVAGNYDATTNEYKDVKSFEYNNKEYSTAHPTISPSGNTLVFASDMPGGEGGTDLYICRKDARNKWSTPANLGKMLNTEGEEMFPFLLDDNTLYFASNGHVGLGGLDIYSVKWGADESSMSEPQHLGIPFNSSYDDMSPVFYPNGHIGYFASNRPAARGGDNIYAMYRQKIFLALKVKDATTGVPLAASNIRLKRLDGSADFITNAAGEIFVQVYPQSQYSMVINRQGYKDKEAEFATFNIIADDTVEQEILLDANFALHYNAVVLDEKTGDPIENPMVVFAQMGGGKADSASIPTGSAYTSELQPDADYHVYAVKDRYYSSERTFSTKGIMRNSGASQINDTIFMKQLKVGEVYKVENIYYDYDKATIREDAKPSLDRLLDLLKQYPDMQIQLNSHTDCRGSASYNLKLSNSRAHSVIKYLQSRGIAADRLKYRGYGASEPIEKCDVCKQCNEAQHQTNRRTEFKIIDL